MNDLHFPHPHLPHPPKPSRHDVVLALVAAVLSAALSIGGGVLVTRSASAAPQALPSVTVWTPTGVEHLHYIDPEPGVRCYREVTLFSAGAPSCTSHAVNP